MFLNTMGLAIGMAGFILIMLWVKDEMSYDKYNENASRIVRTKIEFSIMGKGDNAVVSPAPMAAALIADFPEVENAVRFRDYGSSTIKYEDKSFKENRIIYADSTVFDIFTIPLIKGNLKTALTAPNTITISESAAKKYFGDEDPMGKLLKFNNRKDYEITGVYKDIPSASHFHYDFIASIYSSEECYNNIWVSFNFATYVLLKEGVNHKDFENKLTLLVDNYISVQTSQWMDMPWEKVKENGTNMEVKIQELKDIHLHSHYTGELSVNGDIMYVYIFIIIAIFILILACINFTNLSTAKATSRSKEVGMRKVFGIRTFTLVRNFLLESFIVVFIAHIVAMILVEVSLPYFNDLSRKTLSISYLDPSILIGLIALIIITSLFAGSYPAFYLSSFKPISALKNEVTSGKKKTRFRSILVVGQFVISIVLLTSALVLNKQMSYIQNKNMGFEKENMIALRNTYLLRNSIESFKTDLLKSPDIKKVSTSSFLPIPNSSSSNTVLFKDGIKTPEIASYEVWNIDCDYMSTLGLKIIKGRNFSKDFLTDSTCVLMNETAAKSFGWDDPIGHIIGISSGTNTELGNYTVIGVIEDFNFESVHDPIKPLVCFLNRSTGAMSIRMEAKADVRSTLKFLEKKWKEYAPDQPFEFDFFDESLNQMYAAEVRLGRILISFTVLAFLVSCLGLFGLALFTTEQRKKEIGIRKVNGASISQTIVLLSYDFTKLVVISFIIACPISYYIINKWLENFAYRTNISWWIFAITGLLSYVIAMIAIVYQSYRAAAANPVETLRDE
jgi:putative ABC transport system permease protein